MWGKFIWLKSAALIAYLVGTFPWTKIQPRRIWDEFMRRSAGPKSTVQRSYRKIISPRMQQMLLATLIFLMVIYTAYWFTHEKLELILIKPFKITNWNELRTFGLGLSGVVATWLAIIGAILSAARTKAMEEANQRQADAHNQKQYMDALETLNKAKDYQKAGAEKR